MKTFCSAQEIEDLAAQGRKELVIDHNTVLTDMARQVAQQLGVKIVTKAQPGALTGSASGSTPVVSSLIGSPSLKLGSKPKGCQHAPLTTPPASAAPAAHNPSAAGSSGTVVDQLVGLVKRLGNNKGGSS